MSECKTCGNKNGCWIKRVLDFRDPMPQDSHGQEIVVRASRGDCPSGWDAE